MLSAVGLRVVRFRNDEVGREPSTNLSTNERMGAANLSIRDPFADSFCKKIFSFRDFAL